jgi:inhibitor of cysteine peptidase
LSGSEKRNRRPLVAITIVIIVTLATLTVIHPPLQRGELRSFSSYRELSSFVLQRIRNYPYNQFLRNAGTEGFNTAVPSASTAQAANAYTTTNIQVEGVDEPDIVKTDGQYLYVVSQNKVFVILANPPEQAHIISQLSFNGTIWGIFISPNRLVVIHTGYPNMLVESGTYPATFYAPKVTVHIYDSSDRTRPTIMKELSVQGDYVNSRLTEGNMYVVVQQMAVQTNTSGNLQVVLPATEEDGIQQYIPLTQTYYNPDSDGFVSVYTDILKIRLSDGASDVVSIVTGIGSTIYASLSNMYLTYPEYSAPIPLPGVIGLQARPPAGFSAPFRAWTTQETTIFRVIISNGKLATAAMGSVPGQVLNQFSMDEYNDYFRVATTSYRSLYDGSYVQVNNVYVLDEALKIIGSLEGLAPKERIYSVRFMDDRGYVVTFEKVDPLFAISLTDPQHPKVLDELKMPGFSQYLHPIADGYLIGIGKDAVPAEQGEFAWYQGLKMSLFRADHSGNLSEVAKLLIGDRGSDTPVLYDHKAFTYDPTRGIVALPILVAKIDMSHYVGSTPPNMYGTPVWQGAYLFEVSPSGFKPIGTVTHIPSGKSVQEGHSLYVNRVVLIGESVYTVSEKLVKINNLVTMAEVAIVQIQS